MAKNRILKNSRQERKKAGMPHRRFSRLRRSDFEKFRKKILDDGELDLMMSSGPEKQDVPTAVFSYLYRFEKRMLSCDMNPDIMIHADIDSLGSKLDNDMMVLAGEKNIPKETALGMILHDRPERRDEVEGLLVRVRILADSENSPALELLPEAAPHLYHFSFGTTYEAEMAMYDYADADQMLLRISIIESMLPFENSDYAMDYIAAREARDGIIQAIGNMSSAARLQLGITLENGELSSRGSMERPLGSIDATMKKSLIDVISDPSIQHFCSMIALRDSG
jgi:hypothetical protein